jgi:hypothetical protein
MPFLLVNLDDAADVQRGIRQLRRRLRWAEPAGCDVPAKLPLGAGKADKIPLKQRLMRIKQRGVWRFLVGIARLDDSPRSLQEIDAALDLPPNKMRSTKAIFAKLENRLDVRFLKPAADGGLDQAGNPRYEMPPRIRLKILELAD